MTVSQTIETRLTVRPGVSVRCLDDGGLELAMGDHTLTVNPTGAQIWRLIADNYSESKVIDSLASLYAVDSDQLKQDIRRFLNTLADNLILTTEEVLGSGMNTGVTLRELLRADTPYVKDALPDAFGDSYLCSHNSVYATIRRLAISHGYQYLSGCTDSLSVEYAALPPSCLRRILGGRVIPYYQTRAVLERLQKEEPLQCVSLAFLSRNLKNNHTLYESSHVVAQAIIAQNQFNGDTPATSAARSPIVEALIERAFANTAERLASLEAQSLLHQSFFAWNSHMLTNAPDRRVLEKAYQHLGSQLTFYVLLFAYVISDLYVNEPPAELILGLLNSVGVTDTPTSRNLARMALRLNITFRAETNASLFQIMGFRWEYETLCRRPIQAYLDLVDRLKPVAARLYAVLTPALAKIDQSMANVSTSAKTPLRSATIGETFDGIYRSSIWGGGGDGDLNSGFGSTGFYADQYCILIAPYLRKCGVRSVSDLGCGNFNIGKRVANMVAQYIGMDVAQQVVETNRFLHSSQSVVFVFGDLTRDPLPPADAAIVRQVFQHLSNAEVEAALANICRTYSLAFITEHVYTGADAIPNVDMLRGPGTRVPMKSGVFVDRPPFNCEATPIGDIQYANNEVLRTWVIGNTSRISLLAGTINSAEAGSDQ